MIRGMIRPMISSMVKTMVNPLSGAIKRYFSQLDPVQNSHYPLATPITFAGDFEIEVEFSTTDAGANILAGHWSSSRPILVIENGGTLRYKDNASVTVSSSAGFDDGKLHTVKVRQVGTTVSLHVDGVQVNTSTVVIQNIAFDRLGAYNSGALYFNGIIANPKFTDLSGPEPVTTTFALDNGPLDGDIEYSAENTFGGELVGDGWNDVSANVTALNQDVSFNAVDTSYIYAREPMTIAAGTSYLVEIVVSNYVSGQINLQVKGTSAETLISNQSTSNSFIFTTISSNTTFEVQRTAGTIADMDVNISIREIQSNAVTYEFIPAANREEFQLSDDATQWDNISPPVQVLPAVIEIA